MKRIVLALALLVGGVAVTPLAAAIVEKDASALVLRQQDFPAGAGYDTGTAFDEMLKMKLRAAGVSGNAAYYLGDTYDKKKGSLEVKGNVFAFESAAQSRKAFPIVKRHQEGLYKQYGDPGVTLPRSILPRVGEQQLAWYWAAGNEGIGQIGILARKNTVVWLLEVKVERRPSIPTKAEMVGAARKYGLLQKTRVGSG